MLLDFYEVFHICLQLFQLHLHQPQLSSVNFSNQVFEKNSIWLSERQQLSFCTHSSLFIYCSPPLEGNLSEGRTLSVLLTVSSKPMTVPVVGVYRCLMSEQ